MIGAVNNRYFSAGTGGGNAFQTNQGHIEVGLAVNIGAGGAKAAIYNAARRCGVQLTNFSEYGFLNRNYDFNYSGSYEQCMAFYRWMRSLNA